MQQAIIPYILMLGTIGIFILLLNRIYPGHTDLRSQVKPLEPDSEGAATGQAFLKKSKKLNAALPAQLIGLGTIPVLVSAVHLGCSYFGRIPESWLRIVLSIGAALVLDGFYLYRLCQLMGQRRWYKLAYQQASTATQAIDQLSENSYRVFHDFPANRFSIDHIVIGPTGVMAVKTIIHPVERNDKGQNTPVVTYDGRMLHFPKFSDFESIDQVKRQAEWLSTWLTATLEEEIGARAIVMVPGWVVKRKSAEGISVVNPDQVVKLFEYLKPLPMSQKLMRRIIRQLELHTVMWDQEN